MLLLDDSNVHSLTLYTAVKY